jgi:hypothetical protein
LPLPFIPTTGQDIFGSSSDINQDFQLNLPNSQNLQKFSDPNPNVSARRRPARSAGIFVNLLSVFSIHYDADG